MEADNRNISFPHVAADSFCDKLQYMAFFETYPLNCDMCQLVHFDCIPLK